MRRLTCCLLLAVVLLAGCAGALPADPSKMTPEQLKASSLDRSAVASCTVVNSPWGVGRSIYVQLDKGTIPAGAVVVGTDCAVTVHSTKPPAIVAP